MHRENRGSPPSIRQSHFNATVKTSGSGQSGIEDIGTIGSRKKNHTGILFKAIHFGEQLIQGLLTLIVAATNPCTALPSDGINLINENNARSLLLCFSEQITNPAGAHADEQLDEFRGSHREERHTRFSCNCTGQQRFSGSRWPNKQDTTGNFCPESNEGFGLL